MFRRGESGLEIFLVHPGGPFFRNRDEGAWSLPKGEIAPGEDPLATARREFTEETSLPVPEEGFLPLGEIRQRGGKTVQAWAFEGDADADTVRSNTFEMEWPPRSGKKVSFPEIDRAGFFSPDEARRKLNPAQAVFVDRLEKALRDGGG